MHPPISQTRGSQLWSLISRDGFFNESLVVREIEISQNRRTQPRPAASVEPSGLIGVTGPTMSGFNWSTFR
jgi:hypothetical protein